MEKSNEKIKKKHLRICSVPQCSQKRGEGVHLHHFPHGNQVLLKKWVHILKIGKTVGKGMTVCSRHFEREDYILPDYSTKKPFLKRRAVPSQNLPKSSVPGRKFNSPEKRAREARAKARATARQHCSHGIFEDIPLASVAPTPSPPSTYESEDAMDAAKAMLELQNVLPPSIYEDIKIVEEVQTAEKEVQVTPSILDRKKFTISDVIKTDHHLRAFTGIQTKEKFEIILRLMEMVELSELREGQYALSCRDRLILCLIKLKLNLSFVCLSAFFEITSKTCCKYFSDTLSRLSRVMRELVTYPSKEETAKNMPTCFKNFQSTQIVLDGTEIKIEKINCLKCRIRTYSHYKGGYTAKVLVGVTPSGMISYIGKCYGGRTSDKTLFLASGLLDIVERGGSIMVDKGFLIENECLEKGINLIRPPFKESKKQMSAADAYKTAAIAAARVHVERAIQRLKNFKILKNELSTTLLPFCDDIIVTIAGLSNLAPPILGKDKFLV